MDFPEALADLDARKPEKLKPSLDRIRALAELLDNPQHRYRTIHVTGTNGKTTTARLAARILCGQDVTAGLYTSPHLQSVTERLALCDEPISDEEFAAVYAHLKPYLDEVDGHGDPLSYFETLTGLAYLWMADKPVAAGVYEVGMGGTWDATNLIRSEVAVFCSIDLDHPELGATVQEVASEKAGIIKEGSVVVIQKPSPAVIEGIEPRVVEMQARLCVAGQEYRIPGRVQAVGGEQFAVGTPNAEYRDLFVPLHGWHQVENAAAAIVAAEALLDRELDVDALRTALAGATSPGRMEIVGHRPLVVLDGAHNPDAARRLAQAMGESFVWRRLHLVLGVLREKDIDGILDALASRADLAYACANTSPRSRDAEDTASACRRAGLPVTVHGTVREALDAATAAADDQDMILVTGSLYTVADARRD